MNTDNVYLITKKTMSLLKQRLPLEALRVYQKRYRISDSNKHVNV